MKKEILLLAITGWALASTAALENNGGFTISEVTVKSRQPWQDYVDVDFTLTAPAGREGEWVEMDVVASNGLDNVTIAETSLHAPLAKHGRNRFIWNAGISYSGSTLGKLRFYLAVAQTNVQEKLYFTINLNTGERNWYSAAFSNRVNALFYKGEFMPFRYIPSTVSQAWKELTGTNTFVIGSPDDELWKSENDFSREKQREVKLTHGFWLGVFPVSVIQWEAFGFTTPHNAGRVNYAVRGTTYEMVRGTDRLSSGFCFPVTANVAPNSYIGLLRAKTGLNFDFPTEYQWEYACRAGETNAYWWAPTIVTNYTMLSNPGASKNIVLGTKRPNRWGLYDMVGCVHNWTTTLGRKANSSAESAVHVYADDPAVDADGILVDPVGCTPTYDNATLYRVTRGSHYDAGGETTDRFGNTGPIMQRVYRSAYRYPQIADGGEVYDEGFRLCLTEDQADTEWFPPGE